MVISTDTGRVVRVSWQPPNYPSADAIIEYRIYRAPVTDDYVPPIENDVVYATAAGIGSRQVAPNLPIDSTPPIRDLPGYTLVGVVDGKTTTFVDTTQERTFTYQTIGRGASDMSDVLEAFPQTAAGLTPNRYAYDIRYIYPRAPFYDAVYGKTLQRYNEDKFYIPIQPVRFY